MLQYWDRACEVVRDNFSQRFVYGMATSVDGVVNVRSVYSFMYNDKMYVLTHTNTNKVREIAVNPNVAMVYKAQRVFGTAKNIGHPLEEKNKELTKVIRREMSDAYHQVITEGDENICILEITVNRAIAYTAIHMYDVDFVNNTLVRERHYDQIPEFNPNTLL